MSQRFYKIGLKYLCGFWLLRTDIFQYWYDDRHDSTLHFDSVWTTLTFAQGHRLTSKLELVQSLCCKVAWTRPNFCDGWLCEGDDHKEVLYGQSGLFEHLLFVFSGDARKRKFVCRFINSFKWNSAYCWCNESRTYFVSPWGGGGNKH